MSREKRKLVKKRLMDIMASDRHEIENTVRRRFIEDIKTSKYQKK